MSRPLATVANGWGSKRTGTPRALGEEAIQPAQQAAAAAEHHAVLREIGRQVGTALVERGAQGVDDFFQRVLQGMADFFAADRRPAGKAADRIRAADLGDEFLFQGKGAADVDPQAFGGGQADAEAVVAAEVIDDRPIHAVAAGADAFRGHRIAQAHHGHLGRAAADVADHAGQRLGDRQAGADGRGLGLGHDPHLRGPRPAGRC